MYIARIFWYTCTRGTTKNVNIYTLERYHAQQFVMIINKEVYQEGILSLLSFSVFTWMLLVMLYNVN